MLELIPESLQLSEEHQRFLFELIGRSSLFILGSVVAPFFGRILPFLCWWIVKLVQRFVPINITVIYDEFIKPARQSLVTVGSLVFIALCLNLFDRYLKIYQFLGFALENKSNDKFLFFR